MQSESFEFSAVKLNLPDFNVIKLLPAVAAFFNKIYKLQAIA
jgi:hypothetical protein